MPNHTLSALQDIQCHLEPACNGRSIDKLTGERLAALVGRPKPWSRQLINGVRNGKQPAPKELEHAIMSFVYTIDGVDPIVSQGRPVQVTAVGDVAPGSLVLASDRLCEYPLCNVRFVPTTPRQRHHSRDCQVANYNLKRKARI